jgi:hypothetical protein
MQTDSKLPTGFVKIPSYEHSQNFEKRPLDSSCLSIRQSVRPHGTAWLSLGGFS